MKIQRLYLKDVACFDDLQLEFRTGQDPSKPDVHILVGPNGTGKTSILVALAQMFSWVNIGLEKRLRSPDAYAAIQVDGAGSEACRLVLGGREQSGLQLPPAGQQALTLMLRCEALEHYSADARHTLQNYRKMANTYAPRAPHSLQSRFSFAAFAYSGQRSVAAYELKAIAEPTDGPLADACSFVHATAPSQLVQWIANTRAKEAMASYRGEPELAERRKEAIARIERVVSEVTEVPFAFVLRDDPLWVGARLGGREVELDTLPDGLKSILSWVADLLMRLDRVPWEGDTPILERPFVLFLDEIEVHLHPAWQRRVLPTVQGLFPKAQIFLSTHSPFVVASARDAWIYPLRLEGDKGVADPPVPAHLGSSYMTVLRDVLGIDAEFDVETEKLFARFYELKEQVLGGVLAAAAEFESVAQELARRSVETAAIVEHERRQVARLQGKGAGTR